MKKSIKLKVQENGNNQPNIYNIEVSNDAIPLDLIKALIDQEVIREKQTKKIRLKSAKTNQDIPDLYQPILQQISQDQNDSLILYTLPLDSENLDQTQQNNTFGQSSISEINQQQSFVSRIINNEDSQINILVQYNNHEYQILIDSLTTTTIKDLIQFIQDKITQQENVEIWFGQTNLSKTNQSIHFQDIGISENTILEVRSPGAHSSNLNQTNQITLQISTINGIDSSVINFAISQNQTLDDLQRALLEFYSLKIDVAVIKFYFQSQELINSYDKTLQQLGLVDKSPLTAKFQYQGG